MQPVYPVAVALTVLQSKTTLPPPLDCLCPPVKPSTLFPLYDTNCALYVTPSGDPSIHPIQANAIRRWFSFFAFCIRDSICKKVVASVRWAVSGVATHQLRLRSMLPAPTLTVCQDSQQDDDNFNREQDESFRTKAAETVTSLSLTTDHSALSFIVLFP